MIYAVGGGRRFPMRAAMSWVRGHALPMVGLLVIVLVAGGLAAAVALRNRDGDTAFAGTPGDVTGTVVISGCDAPAEDVQVFGLPWRAAPADSGGDTSPSTSADPSDSGRATPSESSDEPAATPTPQRTSPAQPTPSAATTPPRRPTDSVSPSPTFPSLTPSNVPDLPSLPPEPASPGIRVNPAVHANAVRRAAASAPSPSDATPAGVRAEVAADVDRTAPGAYRFVVAGDQPGLIYRLRLQITTPGCERVAWRPVSGLTYGSAVAGGAPAQISGEVLDSALEVLQSVSSAQRLDGRVLGTWGTRDTVDWTDPATATRVFHWSSAAPGVTSGRWEVSALPFPDTCLAPPSPVIATGDAPYSPGALGQNFMATAFDIDFAEVLASVRARAAATAPASEQLTFISASIAELLRPTTVWVRVVPLGDDGAPGCAAAPSNQVRIDFGATEADTVATIDGWGGAQPVEVEWETYTPHRPGKALVSGAVPVIEIIAPHTLPAAGDTVALLNDPMGATIIASGQAASGADVPVGQRYVLWQKPPDDSVWEEFGEALWSIGEQVGLGYVVDAVNWVSGVYEDVKAGVVAVVADVITATGIVDCGEGTTCRDGVSSALTAGLVALGLPPSLPNFSALANQGLDYLATQISAQSQLPLDQALVVAREAVAQLSQHATSTLPGFPGLGEWYVDLRPAQLGSMTLRVTRPADSPAGPNVGAMNLTGEVYRSATSAPQLPPGASVSFPITLLPQTDGLGFTGGDPAYAQAAWLTEVFDPSQQTSLTVTAGPQSSVLGVLEFPTHTDIGFAGVPTTITNGS